MNMLMVFFGIIFCLQGCSYAISPAMADKADKNITFEMLRADPDAHKGKILLLGGTIAQITSVKQGSLITVDQKPLDFWNKPTRTSRIGGQFLLYSSRQLDALAYAGREITVAAEVAGTRLSVLGNSEQIHPVLITRELKLWPKDQKRPEAQPQWGDPLYAPQRQPQ